MTDVAKCELCGEPMPEGEEMFKFHGYSGPCPKPPLTKSEPVSHAIAVAVKVGDDNRLHEDLSAGRERPFSALQEMLCCLAHAITDERLEAMGFKDESLVLCDNENALTKLVMLWSYEDNYRHAAIYQRGKNGTPERIVSLPTPLRTLGDVRKLLEGLGYSVTKEPA